MEYKICSKCKKEKPATDFTVKKRNKDGLDEECKECKKERKKEWEDKNKDYVRPSRQKISFVCKECGKERTVNKKSYPEDEICSYCKRKHTMKEKYGEDTLLMKEYGLQSLDLSSGYRTCIYCGKKLPISEFAKNSSKKGNVDNICIYCNREKTKKWKESKIDKNI